MRHPTTLVIHVLGSGQLTTPCGLMVESDWSVANTKLGLCKHCGVALKRFKKNGYWGVPLYRW